MKKHNALLYLVLLIAATIVAAAQPITRTDTMQNMEIAKAQDMAISNSKRIDALAASQIEMQMYINRGIGFVVGISGLLTILQIMALLDKKKAQ